MSRFEKNISMKHFLILIYILFALNITAQEISTAFIDSIAQSALEKSPQAGFSIAVVKDGKIVLSKGYGYRDLNKKTKVDENTLFCIASNSKFFTTTSLAMLVDQGKINWNDKVIDYIPEFTMYDSYVREHFTIVDLVTHRSGLGLGAGDLLFIPDGNDFTISDVLNSFQYQKPTSEFRTQYDYDNLLYIVAGEIIKRVTGENWDQFVESHIFNPLQMNNSKGYFENIDNYPNIAEAHSTENGKLELIPTYKDPNKLFGAAGGIYSSANDMAQWLIYNLNRGSMNGDTLVSFDQHRFLWSPQTNMTFDANPSGRYKNHYKAYGLGVQLADEAGYTIVSHTGGMPGMLSHTMFIPELNAGIVVLTNTAPGGYAFYSLTHAIKDELIGVNRVDWVGRMADYASGSLAEADEFMNSVWKTTELNKKKAPNPIKITGVYRDDWFGEVTVLIDGDDLIFRSKRSPKLTGTMLYYQANTYAVKWNYRDMNCDAFAMFVLDENGDATGFTMKGISPNIDFSFDFHDLNFKKVKDDKGSSH